MNAHQRLEKHVAKPKSHLSIIFVSNKKNNAMLESETTKRVHMPVPPHVSADLAVYVSGAGSGVGAGGFCVRSGWSAFTTMVMLGRNSDSYCTHNAATAASCINKISLYENSKYQLRTHPNKMHTTTG